MTLQIQQRSRTRGGAAYVETGRGEPLLLLHGVGMRLEAWTPQLVAFADAHRVIAIDLPGHGESDHIAPGAGLPDFVAWVVGVMDDLALDTFSVAGHSMGALIAAGLAAQYSPRLARVALLSGVGRRRAEARLAVEERARAIREGSFDPAAPLARWFAPGEVGSEAYRLTHAWLMDNNLQGYATAYSAFAQGDRTYADIWPQVRIPALFLTGADDPNSTPDMSRQMAAAAPRGVCHIVEGHRHMVNMTAPAEVNGALRAWLATAEVPA